MIFLWIRFLFTIISRFYFSGRLQYCFFWLVLEWGSIFVGVKVRSSATFEQTFDVFFWNFGSNSYLLLPFVFIYAVFLNIQITVRDYAMINDVYLYLCTVYVFILYTFIFHLPNPSSIWDFFYVFLMMLCHIPFWEPSTVCTLQWHYFVPMIIFIR